MATKANRSIKVSQATIDKIKKQGMSASLKAASSNNSPEYREALRRMYGDARVAKATASTKSSSGRYVGSMFVPDKPAAKAPMGGQPSGYRNPSQAKKASTSYSPRPMSEVNKTTPKPKISGVSRGAPGAPLVTKPKPKPKKKTESGLRTDSYKFQYRQR